MRTKTKLLPVMLIGMGSCYAFLTFFAPGFSLQSFARNQRAFPASTPLIAHAPSTPSDQQLATAFARHQSGIAVEGVGEVIKILPDDNNGIRHQRFILQLASGQTLLVAHNIDLAPRIPSLAIGERIEFKGQYEWNPKGGTIHWTHRDPSGRHAVGWLKHGGRTYQ